MSPGTTTPEPPTPPLENGRPGDAAASGRAPDGALDGSGGAAGAATTGELEFSLGWLIIVTGPGFLCTLLYFVGGFAQAALIPVLLVSLVLGGALIVRAHQLSARSYLVFWGGLLAGVLFASTVFGFSFEPIVRGLDAVLHGLMLAFNYEQSGMPEWDPNVSEGTIYPYFAYVFAVPLGKLIGQDVIGVYSLVVIVLIGLLVAAAIQWGHQRAGATGASAVGAFLAGAFLLRSDLLTVYYLVNDCLLGELYGLVLLALGLGVVSGLRGGRAVRWLCIGYLLATCVLSYPVFVPVFGVALLGLRDGASLRQRIEDGIMGGLIAAPLSLWWVLRNAAGWAVLSNLTAGGELLEVRYLISASLWGLGGLGFVLGWKQRRAWGAGAILVGTVAIYFVAYKAAQLVFPWTSDRMVIKTTHMLPIGLAALGIVGVSVILTRIGRPAVTRAALFVSLLALGHSALIHPERAEPILGHDAIELCKRIRPLNLGDQLHYLTRSIPGDEWCHVVILRGPRDQRHLDIWLGKERCYLQEWLVDPRRGRYLLVEDLELRLGDDYLPVSVRVIERVGDSALLERTR